MSAVGAIGGAAASQVNVNSGGGASAPSATESLRNIQDQAIAEHQAETAAANRIVDVRA